MDTDPNSQLPPRIDALRKNLVENFITVGNASAVRSELEAMPLPELVVRYLNWTRRFIPPRKRTVHFIAGFWKARALFHRDRILALARKIEAGEDLTVYLSPKPFRQAYSQKSLPGSRIDRWRDKDFVLNAYDLHHLHLVEMDSRGRRRGNSRDLVFVRVYRDALLFVFVGDHNSFHDGTASKAAAQWHAIEGRRHLKGIVPRRVERPSNEHIKAAMHGFTTTTVLDGKVYIDANISTDGTGTSTVLHAQQICRVLNQVEAHLDDGYWVTTSFGDAPWQAPSTPVYQWFLDHGDLLLQEETSKSKILIVPGPN